MEGNKELDDFIRKSIKEVDLEKPSIDFTNLVMSKIQVDTERSSVFIHRPLLSKSTWLLILTVIALIFFYVIFGIQDTESSWVSIIQLNRLAAFNLSGRIPNLAASNTMIYGFLTFAFFVIIQVFFIKQRFSKRYTIS